jgi:hypothetical protein
MHFSVFLAIFSRLALLLDFSALRAKLFKGGGHVVYLTTTSLVGIRHYVHEIFCVYANDFVIISKY